MQKNTTTLMTVVFLTGICWLVFTSYGQSAFPSANNCQWQLQTPQSLYVFLWGICLAGLRKATQFRLG